MRTVAHQPIKRSTIRGLSLIELLVSLAIGLILMIAVISAYLGSSGASRVSDAQVRMNEDAQAALTILVQQLRMAGNNPKQPNYTNAAPRNPIYDATTFILRGCDGTFSDITTATGIQTLTCAAGGGIAADSVAISYEADRYNTIPTSANAPTDCLGQSVPVTNGIHNVWNGAAVAPTAVSYAVADNRFYIGTSSVITAPTLYCKGNGGTVAQPLVENIEDLQFTYGTALAAAAPEALAVAGYLSATEVLSDTNLAALATEAERWAKVLTVRICVVARSEQPVVSDAASARYIKCDGTTNTSPPDLRLRRAYSTVVVLRNRAPS
ncbi:MAG: PilW family protein [Polaromonas sp.]|nr:PilW family protein [Polaromonas sp.]